MQNLADLSPLAPEIFLLGGVAFLLLADLGISPARRGLIHFGALLTLAISAILTLRTAAPEFAGSGVRLLSGMFVRDALSDLMKLGIDVVTMAVLIYAKPSLKERGLFQGEYYVLVLFSVLGMMLMVSAGNLLALYLGLELLALCLYTLVALNRDSPLSSEAAMKYFVLGALASGLLLYGMSMVYGAAGSLDLLAIHQKTLGGSDHLLFLFGLSFLVVGIAFKFGAVPFHMWVPDVYQGAPTAVTLFISSAPKIAAFGLTYRLLNDGFGGMVTDWRAMLAVLAALSLVVGNLVAIAQTNIKRMLAYSTIGHVGFLFLGLLNGSPTGYSAALFYALSYAITSAAAFGLIIMLSRAGFEAEEIDDFRGLNQRNSWYALLMMLVMASFAGVPMLVGFIAKLQVLKSAIDAGLLWLAILGGVFAVIGAFYYLRVIKVMYFDEPKSSDPLSLPNDLPFRVALSINGLALVALGLAAGPLLNWCVQVTLR